MRFFRIPSDSVNEYFRGVHSTKDQIDQGGSKSVLLFTCKAAAALILFYCTLFVWGLNRHSLVARAFSPWVEVLHADWVEPQLYFLEQDREFTYALSDGDSRRIFEASGGANGPYRRISVRMVAVTDTRGIWAPTGAQRQIWLLSAVALVTAAEEEKYETIAPCVLPQAYDIWRNDPDLRPYVEILEANGFVETFPQHGIVTGPWRTNWWGYVINTITILALAVLTSPLWWHRLQKWRHRAAKPTPNTAH